MNIPNKLTTFRVFITPLFMVLFTNSLYIGESPNSNLNFYLSALSMFIFGWMEISDIMDGQIARRYNLVSDLGKVYDPFSDAFMHLSFFFVFSLMHYMHPIAFVIILWRELVMFFIRLLLSKEGIALPADIFGKIKTGAYAIYSFLVIFWDAFLKRICAPIYKDMCSSLLYYLSLICSLFALLSFINYWVKIKKGKLFANITM